MSGVPYKSVKAVGALLSVSAFHKKVPMSCLRRLDALEENSWKY